MVKQHQAQADKRIICGRNVRKTTLPKMSLLPHYREVNQELSNYSNN